MQDDLVCEVVDPLARLRIDPNDHGQAANHHFNPDAGNDGARRWTLLAEIQISVTST